MSNNEAEIVPRHIRCARGTPRGQCHPQRPQTRRRKIRMEKHLVPASPGHPSCAEMAPPPLPPSPKCPLFPQASPPFDHAAARRESGLPRPHSDRREGGGRSVAVEACEAVAAVAPSAAATPLLRRRECGHCGGVAMRLILTPLTPAPLPACLAKGE